MRNKFAQLLGLAILLLPLWPVAASDPPGVVFVPLADHSKALAGKIDKENKATLPVDRFGSHGVVIVRREGNGPAEWHDNHGHIMVVQSGEGIIRLGGDIVDPKTIRPGEVLGTSLRNAVEKKMTTGDILYIPIRTSHQYIVEAGKQVTFFVMQDEVAPAPK